MAGLGFDVQIKNLEKFEEVKKKMAEVRESMKKLKDAGDTAGANKQLEYYKKLQKEHDKLKKSLNPVIHEFQQLNKAAQNTFKDIANASGVNDLTEQLIIQKKVIIDLEEQYKKYKAEYDKLNTSNLNPGTKRGQNYSQKALYECKTRYRTRKELESELARVGIAYNTVRKEQKLLTTAGSATLSGMISGISGLAGAFSATQGVLPLCL